MQRAGAACNFVYHTEGEKLYKRSLNLTKRTANNSNVMQETGQKWKAARRGEKKQQIRLSNYQISQNIEINQALPICFEMVAQSRKSGLDNK